MRFLIFLIASVLVNLSTCLITLKGPSLNLDYKIAGISNLYLNLSDSIFFTSSSNIFGFLNNTNGLITSIYELQSDEKIIRFHDKGQIVIAKGKYLKNFNISQAKYSQLKESQFLNDYQDFDTFEDFIRTEDGNTFILTNTYLMKIQIKNKGTAAQNKSEEILITANNSQTFFSLGIFYNYKIGKEDVYLTSTRPASSRDVDLCFRKVSQLNEDPFCFNIPKDKPILDIVYSSGHIFIVFQEKSLLLTPRLQFIQRIQGQISQYFHGFIGLADKFQSFNLPSKQIISAKIITENMNNIVLIREIVLVNETILVRNYLQEAEGNDIVVIQRNGLVPRKVWTKTSSTNNMYFSLFIESQNGKLTCFDIDQSTSTYQIRWQIQVGSAPSKSENKMKVDGSNDIQINDPL